jgi:hypothetical protein
MRCHSVIERLFCQPSPLLQLVAGGRGGGGGEEAEEAERRAPCDGSVVADMEPRVGGKITRRPSRTANLNVRDGGSCIEYIALIQF